MSIETARLRLIPYAPGHLLALIEGMQQFGACFGIPAAEGLREFMVSDDISPNWLQQLRSAPPNADPWHFGFGVVDRQSGAVIGMAGFKGPPDQRQAVEIAYGIVPAFQGRGFASEAAAALVDFAFRRSDVQLVCAHTEPTENASTRVLSKNGFQLRGEVLDPEDGRVWRWERRKETELESQ